MSSLRALTSRIGWVSVHKTIQFTSESLVALLIIAKAWWQWWDLATNVSESVWWFQLLSLLLCISFNFWNLFSGSCVVAKSENMSQITILEIDLYRYNQLDEHDHNWFIISRCSCSSPLLAWMILEISPGSGLEIFQIILWTLSSHNDGLTLHIYVTKCRPHCLFELLHWKIEAN